MKKLGMAGLLFLLLLTAASTAAAAPNTYQVLVNGHIVTGDTLTVSNTTLVPFKVIFQELDYTMSYDAAAKTIKAGKTGTSVVLTVGSTKSYVNGRETKLPVAPRIVNGVTYVPLRFIANASGEAVTFDNSWHAIQIGKPIDWKLLGNSSFRNAKWGMTMSQVKQSENSLLIETITDGKEPYLHYQSKIAGFDATSLYFFYNQSLESAGYFVKLSGPDSYVRDYKALTAYLTEQYGEPTLEMMQRFHDGGLDYTDEEWLQLILSGELDGLVATWRTVDTEIMLSVAPNLQYYSDIQISYTSWRHLW